MSAAIAAADNRSLSITVVDDNPLLGGQICRPELGKTRSPDAIKLIEAIENGQICVINDAQVFAVSGESSLAAETPKGRIDLRFGQLIIATGARERFLPFPGWTLPGVFGAGGLQALVKSGFPLEGKRVVVAGTGPLLIEVAGYLRNRGARILTVAEQASWSTL